jgi:hypothetical protein
MEKTLTIDGKEVRFKSTAATPLRYKAQFGKDFFSELLKMNKLGKLNLNEKDDDEAIQSLDFDVFYNIVWSLAKTADKSIPDPLNWYDEFESFPLMEIIPELQELITSSIEGKKK